MLRASEFSLDTELAIHSMNLQQAVDQNVEGEEESACKIGTMKVRRLNRFCTLYLNMITGSC